MTSIYFVRHAQPDYSWIEDSTRPLTADGIKDSEAVAKLFAHISIDHFYSSPYVRTMETIEKSCKNAGKSIKTDYRLRERESGINGNTRDLIEKRWADFNYAEENGECLYSVQKRNIEALEEILNKHKDEKIVIGTHGTALSIIMNFYDNSYVCHNFFRILDYMPYVIRIDFNGLDFAGKEELLIIEKEFKKQ